jgi:zinc protease
VSRRPSTPQSATSRFHNGLGLAWPWLFSLPLACSAAAPAPSTPTVAPTAVATSTPTASAVEAKQQPPAPMPSPLVPFPKVQSTQLDNGLGLKVVSTQGLPLVHIALVVGAGSATDGDKIGVATVTGELLKEGGAGRLTGLDLLGQLEALGASLAVTTGADATTLSVDATTEQLEPVLQLLSSLVREPRLPKDAFTRVRDQERERVESQARSSGAWAASMVLYRQLYRQPTGGHPYAEVDATPAALGRLTVADCRAWHRGHFQPDATTLVIAGAITAEQAARAAQTAFGSWRGQALPRAAISAPLPLIGREVFVVDRKDSSQSDVYVALWGPERRSEDWPALSVVNQVLGGGVAGRLFMDVREQRSLAYRTGSAVREPASGPAPILLVAGTRTERTVEAVEALLQHVTLLSSKSPSEQEVKDAARFISDSFAMDLERVEGVGNLTERLVTRRLDDGYWDEFRGRVREVTTAQTQAVAQQYFSSDRAIVVVAGDAKSISEGLRRFGPVQVFDPEKDFTMTGKFAALSGAPTPPAAADN